MAGMVILDWRYRLAFWHNPRRATITVLIGFLLFVIWDVFGISLGIFFSGHSIYMSGIYLAPEFPIEEVFFLLFLCYFTLISYRLLEKKL